MSVLEVDRPYTPPIWRMAVASFLPFDKRAGAIRGWVSYVPLAVVLLLQAFTSMRLRNSTHSDEGIYLVAGHWYRSGIPVYTHPENFFSGSPQLYPVISSYLDSLGGLQLVRIFAGLYMLSATIAVYWMTSEMFAHRRGHRAGILAALVFSLSAPVIFIGHLGTFDSPSFAMLAWAAALAVWSSKRNTSMWWSVPVGALAATAVLFKYSAAIDVPFVLLLTLISWSNHNLRGRTLLRGLLAGSTTLLILGVSAATWARGNLAGLIATTVNREVGSKGSASYLYSQVFTWSGVTITLMILGGLLLLRRQPVLASVLLLGLAAAVAFQIRTGESTSLNKHVVLGLIFGAPLAGSLLSNVISHRRILGTIFTCAVLWAGLLLGLSQSAELFTSWPNTTGLVQTLDYSVKAMPWIRTVGDIPEPAEYAFRGRTQHWQWTAMWTGSFRYKGMVDLPAYEQALKDNYFQLAFFDDGKGGTTDAANCGNNCTVYSALLTPRMTSFGFKRTGTVTAPDGHAWAIWQRYDGVPRK